MFLSRVEIDTNNRRKIRDLFHLGAYHSWVEDSFPQEAGNAKTRKLWRIDSLNGKEYLLIVSQDRPDLKRLEKYGVSGTAETKKYDSFLNNIAAGQIYRFKATLNPVHSVLEDSSKRGRVYPEITVEQQMNFLLTRAEKYGFHLEPDDFIVTERHFDILKHKDSRPVRLSRVTYEGKLTVVDAEIFRHTLTEGIGKKKAYGCGLMTVIPESN